jgi:hypothetical protein
MTDAMRSCSTLIPFFAAALGAASCTNGSVAGGAAHGDAAGTSIPIPGIDPGGPTSDGGIGAAPDYPPLPDAHLTIQVDLGALGTPPPSDPATQSLNVRGCTPLQMGPFTPVMGAAVYSYGAPAVKSDGLAYRVTFPKAGGYVSLVAPAAGDYVFFTSTAAPITVFSLAGEFVTPKTLATRIPECMQVKNRAVFTLKMESHVIKIGPEPTGTVDVVVLPAGN